MSRVERSTQILRKIILYIGLQKVIQSNFFYLYMNWGELVGSCDVYELFMASLCFFCLFSFLKEGKPKCIKIWE